MYNINHNIEYFQENYITPSLTIKKQNYLLNARYNLKTNNKTQLIVIYNELLRILTAIQKYIKLADKEIDIDLENQLMLFRQDYPITQEKYANYCSTILSLIYKDTVNFADIAIQTTYNNLKNKIIFTGFAQKIIKQTAQFINSKNNRYNYLVDILNNNNDHLPICTNYITENYLTIVENNITILTNEKYNI